MDIKKKLKELPARPGVYMMKGKSGAILYIGKAKSLRSRVRSYFLKTADDRYATRFLATRTDDIDCIVTATEKEALFLEETLLKRHKPKYNIRLKDSKTYVSIKLTMATEFPRILVTRRITEDGSRYFGPYTSAKAVRETVRLIRKIFPLCVCSPSVFKSRTRPCLDAQLGICAAPCVGEITPEAYAELVDGAIMFLEGRSSALVKDLKAKMAAAASASEFEKAAGLRDRVSAIEEMLEAQRVVSLKSINQDVFAVATDTDTLAIQVMLVRNGRLVKSDCYIFKNTGLPVAETLNSFITQYYRSDRYVAPVILLSTKINDRRFVEALLAEKAGRKVTLSVPAKGAKLKLVKMATENGAEAVRKRATEAAADTDTLEALKKRLRLKALPERIEAFDISNLGASSPVGAMVSFVNGKPYKKDYRLFKITGVKGPDDYAMMREVLRRRYSAHGLGLKDAPELMPPDLILIDGGKGQLNIAVKVMAELGMEGVAVAALAKDKPDGGRRFSKAAEAPKGERVFLPGVKDPILLRENSAGDLLLRRIRDEVHRFAIRYQRKLRGKAALKSPLDDIAGIGAKKKQALYKKFGDIEGIRKASVKDLSETPGITEKLAKAIKAGVVKIDSTRPELLFTLLFAKNNDINI